MGVLESYFSGLLGETTGTLSNFREILDRKQVDKKVKVFSTCDEFLLHAFKSHMIAAICQVLGVDNPNADIPHTPSYQWLEETAKSIVQATINVPEPSKDTVFLFLSLISACIISLRRFKKCN